MNDRLSFAPFSIGVSLISVLCLLNTEAIGAVVQLTSPGDFPYRATSISFDDVNVGGQFGVPVANTLFLGRGVEFKRDDGLSIPLFNWEYVNRDTTSPPNVIATIGGTFEGNVVPTAVNHIDLVFSSPTLAVGSFFGNDNPAFNGFVETLSVFDENDSLLGSVTVTSNSNLSVDQFIGLRSDAPFSKARFENFGQSSLSVVLDDVIFLSVPEPSACLLLCLSMTTLLHPRRRTGAFFLNHVGKLLTPLSELFGLSYWCSSNLPRSEWCLGRSVGVDSLRIVP